MWSLMTEPDAGTLYYSRSSQTMNLLDQFLLSRGLYFGLSGLQIPERAPGVPHVEIFRPEVMLTRKHRPREFRRESRTGYSDHFPILTRLNLLPT